jgi:hypothetical protein
LGYRRDFYGSLKKLQLVVYGVTIARIVLYGDSILRSAKIIGATAGS